MQEAQAVVGRALKDNFDDPDLREAQYEIDFMQGQCGRNGATNGLVGG